MGDTRTVFFFRWMNRERYKDKNGKLNIKKTGAYETEDEANKRYAEYDGFGYAIQMCTTRVTTLDIVGNKKHANLWSPASTVIKENERWKMRIKARDRITLVNKIESLKTQLTKANEELAQMDAETSEMHMHVDTRL